MLSVIEPSNIDRARKAIEEDGYCVIRPRLPAGLISEWQRQLDEALAKDTAEVLRRDRVSYAARNLTALWPESLDVIRACGLDAMLREVLGSQFGLVRAILFDKPAAHSWSVTWHQDLTIAIDRKCDDPRLAKPTVKAGVPHAEAPTELLTRMLTARVHLDKVTEENGPLRVVPGSHRLDKLNDAELDQVAQSSFTTILAEPGDVLLMRPLLAHSSPRHAAGSSGRRRVAHFEFAGRAEPISGIGWHLFVPGEQIGRQSQARSE